MSVSRLGLLVLIIVIFVSCDSSRQSDAKAVKEEAKQAIEATELFFAKQKQAFKIETEKGLKSLRAEIDSLESQADTMSSESKDKFEKAKETAEESLDKIEEGMAALKNKSKDVWGSFEKTTVASLDDVKEKIDDLKNWKEN